MHVASAVCSDLSFAHLPTFNCLLFLKRSSRWNGRCLDIHCQRPFTASRRTASLPHACKVVWVHRNPFNGLLMLINPQSKHGGAGGRHSKNDGARTSSIKAVRTLAKENACQNSLFQNSINQRLAMIQEVFIQVVNLSKKGELHAIWTCPITILFWIESLHHYLLNKRMQFALADQAIVGL